VIECVYRPPLPTFAGCIPITEFDRRVDAKVDIAPEKTA
jgi:hypothetical protein